MRTKLRLSTSKTSTRTRIAIGERRGRIGCHVIDPDGKYHILTLVLNGNPQNDGETLGQRAKAFIEIEQVNDHYLQNGWTMGEDLQLKRCAAVKTEVLIGFYAALKAPQSP